MDHVPDSFAKILSSHNLVFQNRIDSIFALVALGQATSAKLKNLYEHVNIVSEAIESLDVKEEQALDKGFQGIGVFGLSSNFSHDMLIVLSNK